MEKLLEVKDLKVTFFTDLGETQAVKGAGFAIGEGDFFGIVGESGSGKSVTTKSILRLGPSNCKIMGGEILFRGEDILKKNEAELREIRGGEIAMIFQDPMSTLNPVYTVGSQILENLNQHEKLSKQEAMQRAIEMLRDLGLGNRMKHKPTQMSGGQQQRVAIARALATNPKVLLCDEATSALDPKTTRQILELIGDINKKLGITVVIITHQMSVVKEVCNHVAILDDGEVVEEGLVSTVFSAPKSAAARHLVFPRGADIDVSDPQQQRRIRLIFRSAKTTSIPLVARLATDEGISATVISANTQKLSEEVYGSMLLGVPNAQFEQAMDFLRSIENLQVEEASVDVQ